MENHPSMGESFISVLTAASRAVHSGQVFGVGTKSGRLRVRCFGSV